MHEERGEDSKGEGKDRMAQCVLLWVPGLLMPLLMEKVGEKTHLEIS